MELVETFALIACWRSVSNLLNQMAKFHTTHSLLYLMLTCYLMFIKCLQLIKLVKCFKRKTKCYHILFTIVCILLFVNTILFWEFYWATFESFAKSLSSNHALSIYLLIGHVSCVCFSIALDSVQLLSGPACALNTADNNEMSQENNKSTDMIQINYLTDYEMFYQVFFYFNLKKNYYVITI